MNSLPYRLEMPHKGARPSERCVASLWTSQPKRRDVDTLFFLASKIIWSALKPESWILLAVGITCLMVWRNRLRSARIWASCSLLLILAIGYFPIGGWLVAPLEHRFPPTPDLVKVDGIIMLGGAEQWPRHNRPQAHDGAERFMDTMYLANRFPDAKVLFTGGSASLSNLEIESAPNAESPRIFFDDMGLAEDRLYLERASRNTAENAAFSLDLMAPQTGETWVLVTSAFHMPRAYRTFERAGWPGLIAWPVDFRQDWRPISGWDLAQNLYQLNLVMKEYIGLVAYGVTGR
ncbi:uncharacterized SAM-binding protein YcdF (DUF218 family) [Aliiruegeria haliotis]|uniref:Uncharacterized SAM-binding protein YcdF (DUF218 family) n=1 Tax=Aliiruegeria haliotis TaxID=1280846 RepID=A0A2T0RI69_9RHOB|nr:YdcF family protein [Aliiruegeria haliotis]PRY20883.1 uncharacterized SAM-binding protein YcdF (DUF218 family) [Aliiruegeria haliotis]